MSGEEETPREPASEAAAPLPQPAPAPAPATSAPTGGAPAAQPSPAPLLLVLALVAAVVGVALLRSGGEEDELPVTPQALMQEANRRPDPREALPYLQRALELAPDDAIVNAKLGQALALSHRYEEALPLLERAISLGGQDVHPEVYRLQGVCLLGLQRPADAVAPLEKAAALAPEIPMPLYDLGVAAMLRRDNQGVVDNLSRFLAHERVQGRNPVAQRMLADAYERLGQHDDAVATLTSLAQLTPGDVRLREELQDRALEREGPEATLEQSRRLVEGAQQPAAIDLYLYGRLLSLFPGRDQEARALLERSHQADANQPWPLLALAVLQLRDGQPDAARRSLEEAIQVDPRQPDGALQLAHLERLQGRYEEARLRYQRFLESPLAPTVQQEIVACYLEAGQGEEALRYAQEQLQGVPPEHPARSLEVRALAGLGRYDEALALFRKILAGVPGTDSTVYQARLARYLLEAGQSGAAREVYDKLLPRGGAGERLAPEVRFLAGVSHFQAGDPEGARTIWEQGATQGRTWHPEVFWTWACGRALGRMTADELAQAARLGGPIDVNDGLFAEGLARELAGDLEGARDAYRQGLERSRGDEFPQALCKQGLARLQDR